MDFLTINELKKLSLEETKEYCDFLRSYVIDNVTAGEGHLASNLGVTEISVALIRLFNSPEDKIIYDVGHQSYIHKLLTNRIFDSKNLRTYNGYAGFTKRDESEHDPFGSGHSSTALSAALGFSRAATIKGEDSYSVAVIGDGAFCTGMTFEAQNNVTKDDKLIIILNDNEMSISKNVGTFSAYLNRIRINSKYLKFKRGTKSTFSKVPLLSKPLLSIASKIKTFVKRVFIKPNFFEDLGIEYLGPANGNDIETVERLIVEAKSRNCPVLIHFVTKKGKGLKEAEEDPKKFHFVSSSSPKNKTFSTEFTTLLTEYSKENENTVAITAAMAEGTGLVNFKEKFPERFFDVGICEEHAPTFAAALSAGGMLPFYVVYSTFFQRSYDQIIHDIALQNLKTVIALDRAGFVGSDGPTHHGLFDVSMMLTVPGSTIYSPSTFEELKYSFKKCVKHDGVSVLRYPKDADNEFLSQNFSSSKDFLLDTKDTCDVLIVTYGRVSEQALKAKLLLSKTGAKVSVLKFVKLKPLDFKKISKLILALNPKHIFVVEEGMKTGGFGEYFFSNVDYSCHKEVFAIDETFVPQGTLEELYSHTKLDAKSIYTRIKKWI